MLPEMQHKKRAESIRFSPFCLTVFGYFEIKPSLINRFTTNWAKVLEKASTEDGLVVSDCADQTSCSVFAS